MQKRHRRSNPEWQDELRGRHGSEQQAQAFEDLAAYMYRVAHNYLLYRQGQANPHILVSFAPEELAIFAEDFVQETLRKLVNNDFALLDKFSGKSAFTTWVARVVKNEAGQELRKSYWERRVLLPSQGSEQDEEQSSTFELIIPSKEECIEQAMIEDEVREEVREALRGCLEGLKESQRLALLGLIVEGFSGEELAHMLNRPSRNAVFLLVRRAKRNMRKCLEEKSWVRDYYLEIFSP